MRILATVLAGTLIAVPCLAQSLDPARAPLSRADQTFAIQAANGGRLEVALGGMAERQGGTVAVKDFGKHMVLDDRVANATLARIATRNEIALPQRQGGVAAAIRDRLVAESGLDFDRDYVHTALWLQKNAVALFEAEARTGRNLVLRRFAKTTLPVLRQHLKMADALEADIEQHALHLSTFAAPAAAPPGSQTGSRPGLESHR
ncbi:MAG: DUF4142 domain-containing protein [Stellaceae bacterium]